MAFEKTAGAENPKNDILQEFKMTNSSSIVVTTCRSTIISTVFLKKS
jgi:hypothetical protein